MSTLVKDDAEIDFLEEDEQDLEPKYAHTLQLESNGINNSNHCSSSLSKHALRCRWAHGEVGVFLNIINKLKLQGPLLRKRNAKVFKLVSREMAKMNIVKRPDQLRIKYHQLRRQYAKSKTDGEPFEYFQQMHELINAKVSDAEESELEGSDDEEEVASEGTEDALVADMPKIARCKWAEGEVDVFLNIIISMGLQSALLRKRNAKIFKLLSKEMAKRDYNKAPEKLRIKYQMLRRQYNKAKNGGESFEHFDIMDQLLNQPGAAELEAESSSSESDCSESGSSEADATKSHADYYWTDPEVDSFLSIIKEQNLFRAVDGSKKRNFKTLAYISKVLAQQSYQRTPDQLRNKLRLLLRRYREAKTEGIKNVRLLSRHFEILDDLVQKRRSKEPTQAPKSLVHIEASDSDELSSDSSCDLLRSAAAAAGSEHDYELPAEPTPLEVLSSISEGQKQLLTQLSSSHERFLQQQREMQTQFLQELSRIMRQEREATCRMLKELLQNKS
ncbi:uncharacterized protein LOC108595514 isoform X2 [Drosophila busckii]|uniref:uncharacterized protein LOC108595514 isoform X2 n=1 Tax=Drosophila busckii TaxID=30019 RepID=UPI00083EE7EE|nr:uncharacterized protein LOC108595514 isoform X2 [Drosophila busckii]